MSKTWKLAALFPALLAPIYTAQQQDSTSLTVKAIFKIVPALLQRLWGEDVGGAHYFTVVSPGRCLSLRFRLAKQHRANQHLRATEVV